MSERAFVVITGISSGDPGVAVVTCSYEVVDSEGTSAHHVGTAQVDVIYADTPHDVREKLAAQIRTISVDPALSVVFVTAH